MRMIRNLFRGLIGFRESLRRVIDGTEALLIPTLFILWLDTGKVTPLFASMLVQPTEDEGAPSERPSEAQPTPSPAPTSEVPIKPQTDSSPVHTKIQALFEKVKRFDESFTVVGSTKDERRIKEMNKGVKDTNQKRLKEEDIEKVPAKVQVTKHGSKKRKGGHIKMIARKNLRKQSDDDNDDENRKCLKIVTFEGTLDSEIMEKKYVIARLDKVSSPDGDYLVIYRANRNFRAFNYLIEVLHIFDRKDLFHLYELVMEQYSKITLEGFELILWGDLKIMMESSTEENDQSDFWSNQQDWKIITWRLYEACGVCILELEDGIVIHMLVERRYPLSKELLQRMLDLGLEVERESTVALDLIRFIKKQIDEE
ncbi:hypothetical protein Tco_0713061 [Tanacetum coccineum]